MKLLLGVCKEGINLICDLMDMCQDLGNTVRHCGKYSYCDNCSLLYVVLQSRRRRKGTEFTKRKAIAEFHCFW